MSGDGSPAIALSYACWGCSLFLLVDCTMRGPCVVFPSRQIQNTATFTFWSKLEAPGRCRMRDVSLSKPHTSVWVAAETGTGTGVGQGQGMSPGHRFTGHFHGQWHAEAALLGNGDKGDSSLMLQEAPCFPPQHLLLLPSFPP